MTSSDPNRATLSTWFFALATMAISVCFLWYGRDLLIPLSITGLLFILSSALVDKIQCVTLMGRTPPMWLAQVFSVLVIIAVILFLGLIVSSSVEEIQDALPRYHERSLIIMERIESLLGPKMVVAGLKAAETIDLGSWAAAVLGQLGGALSLLGLVALYLAFLASERMAWIEKLPRMATTEEESRKAQRILARISDGVKQYMWVNAVTSAMSGVVAFGIFTWVGLDFAPLLALTVFFAGFIPNIGAFIGIALPSLVALIQFDDFTPFLIVLIGYGGADQFIANVIQPAMQGRSLNLSTFMVMVALTFWSSIWGGIGAFLAIPLTVVVMVIFAEIPAARWIAVLLSSDGQLLGERLPDVDETSAQPTRRGGSEPLKREVFDAEVKKLRAEFEDRNA
ncbi:AI-2E family transporter [Shimia abyssi]|uniref:Putative PurR-regulated permease PerM n=1 Tax=Shimia abyssi TaxID=1662395 RepID=A0A2P8F7M1_9RHOB|nr:AI-2E family transporter [Shimia abyssi]PSL17708.1 putative PurR-regulated permease PerM [Shimia abyssi]